MPDGRRMTGVPPPEQLFPSGLPEERTSQAWERTAIAMMVAGLLLARYAAEDGVALVAVVGVAQTVAGAGLLVWAGARYAEFTDPTRDDRELVHPGAVRLLGLGTVACLASALVLAVVLTVAG